MNVIFDSSYFAYRTLYVVKQFSKSDIFLDSEQDQINFLKKLKTDFIYELNKISELGNIQRIIFCMDDRNNWRKTIYEGYKLKRKDTREKQDINFSKMFELLEKFIKFIVDEYGVTAMKINQAEADDLIMLWSLALLSKNQNTIIISMDKDLEQLVQINKTKDAFIVVYNNHSMSQTLVVNEDILNLFNILKKQSATQHSLLEINKVRTNPNDYSDLLKKDVAICNNLLSGGLKSKITDKETLLRDKIFLGDKSDEINNVISIPNKDPKKRDVKITRTHLRKMEEFLQTKFADYKFAEIDTNMDLRYECGNYLSNLLNLNDDQRMLILENILINAKLIILKPTVNNPIFEKIVKEFLVEVKKIKQQQIDNPLVLGGLTEKFNTTKLFEQVLEIEDYVDENENKIQMIFEM